MAILGTLKSLTTEVQSELLHGGRFTANQFVSGAEPLEAHKPEIFISTEPLR
jgi:hypothetical protein